MILEELKGVIPTGLAFPVPVLQGDVSALRIFRSTFLGPLQSFAICRMFDLGHCTLTFLGILAFSSTWWQR